MTPVLLALSLAGCLTAQAPEAPACVDCHGSEASPAPPAGLGGVDDPGYIGVGAHSRHLTGAVFSRPVSCTECHALPATLDAPGHVDTPWPAEVPWGPLAGQDEGATPWSHTDGTCTVYCHGSTLTGGTNTAPGWTEGAAAASCGACHGMPPPAPHPQAAGECGLCHAPAAEGSGIADPLLHIDGIVQLSSGTTTDTTDTGPPAPCWAGCHTPDPDVDGAPDQGAHHVHSAGGAIGAAVACSDCHLVPAETSAPGHLADDPSDVTFDGVAILRSSAPVWDGATCADSYCHAAFGGGTVPQPDWTVLDGSQSACGSCHGNPPPGPVHQPTDTNCELCHSQVAGPGQTIVDPELHCDGLVQL